MGAEIKEVNDFSSGRLSMNYLSAIIALLLACFEIEISQDSIIAG